MFVMIFTVQLTNSAEVSATTTLHSHRIRVITDIAEQVAENSLSSPTTSAAAHGGSDYRDESADPVAAISATVIPSNGPDSDNTGETTTTTTDGWRSVNVTNSNSMQHEHDQASADTSVPQTATGAATVRPSNGTDYNLNGKNTTDGWKSVNVTSSNSMQHEPDQASADTSVPKVAAETATVLPSNGTDYNLNAQNTTDGWKSANVAGSKPLQHEPDQAVTSIPSAQVVAHFGEKPTSQAALSANGSLVPGAEPDNQTDLSASGPSAASGAVWIDAELANQNGQDGKLKRTITQLHYETDGNVSCPATGLPLQVQV
jgi:hypothetical protein